MGGLELGGRVFRLDGEEVGGCLGWMVRGWEGV